jgi:chaperonin cofactor prefoldin
LLIITVALFYTVQTKLSESADVEKQTFDLQNQIAYCENLTNTLRNSTNELQKSAIEIQNLVDELQNSTTTLQTQTNDLQAQLADLQNPIYNVTIENVTQDSWWNPGGVALLKDISFEIKNTGTRDVGGLTVVCEIQANGTVWDSKAYSVGCGTRAGQIGILHPQESVVMSAGIGSGIGVAFAGKDFVIKIMLDNTTLDEYALPLQATFFE